jgi:hypothetical protein
MEHEAISSSSPTAFFIVVNSIDVNTLLRLSCPWSQIFLMKETSSDAIHIWLVLNKAGQAITR